MSAEPNAAPIAPSDAMAVDANNHPRKSYRRKYRKIMVKFEERMRESTTLFKDEQRIFDISQRLVEQTDQILQMLLEINQTPQVPSNLRYDLNLSNKGHQIVLERQSDKAPAHESLRLGRYQVQKGERTTQEYEEGKKELLNTAEFAPSRSYTSLSKITTATPVSHDATADPSIPSSAGYMTIRQEEQYLQGLDAFIAGKSASPRIHAANSLGSKSAERTTDRERETQLRNPVSVYNWLRKHQPQVFLQDHETPLEKGTKMTGFRVSRRSNASKDKEAKQEQDYYDDDGIAVEYGASSKGKRKRNDDGAFRPKGGKPGHGAKKRKEDSGRRSKRSSMDARIS